MAAGTIQSRKLKRKMERMEKKQKKSKRLRQEDESNKPVATKNSGKKRTNKAISGSRRNTGIQNKFHELIKETMGEKVQTTGRKTSRRSEEEQAELNADDREIKDLEKKLGLSSGKDAGYKKLKNEYAKDGFGDDFIDFLSGLDNISKLVKERKKQSTKHDQVDEESADDEQDDDESEADEDEEFEDDEMEMDEETRREFEMLQKEDAAFLDGMDELPTDASESDEDMDLAAFDTEDEDEEDEDDEVKKNTLMNQTAKPEEEDDEDEDEEEEDDDDEDKEDQEEEEEEEAKEVKLVIEEDIYGRPIMKTTDGDKVPSAYIPPHLRRKMQEQGSATSKSSVLDEVAMRELTRRINGQLNRISESNMESIALELEKIYREYARSVVNQVLLDKMIQMCTHERQVMTSLIKVCAALMAALFHSVGTEVAGFFVEKLVCKLMDLIPQIEEVDGELSKVPVNLLLLIAMLYNLSVVQCTLIYDLFRSFVNGFANIEIELMYHLLKSCGPQLRADDADALREMVTLVQQKVASESQQSERIRFILDLIYDLKKSSKKNRQHEVDLSGLKKWLGRVKTRCNNTNNALRLSLHELLHANQDGRWWIVGGTWVGYQQPKDKELDKENEADQVRQAHENQLLKLAEKQRMNTDVRKKIFVAIMGASDCLDAYERLLQLHLKEKQEREIVRVLLHCVGNEKQFNKYYQLLGDKLCEMDPRFKFTFQLAFWDLFKQLETFKLRKLYNLASLLAGLLVTGSLSLSIFKVLDFTDLNDQSVLFLRVVFEKLLKLEQEADVTKIFERLLQTKKAQLTIDGIAVFFHQHMTRFKQEENLQVRQQLKLRSKMIKNLLDHLSKSAANAAAMEGFMD